MLRIGRFSVMTHALVPPGEVADHRNVIGLSEAAEVHERWSDWNPVRVVRPNKWTTIKGRRIMLVQNNFAVGACSVITEHDGRRTFHTCGTLFTYLWWSKLVASLVRTNPITDIVMDTTFAKYPGRFDPQNVVVQLNALRKKTRKPLCLVDPYGIYQHLYIPLGFRTTEELEGCPQVVVRNAKGLDRRIVDTAPDPQYTSVQFSDTFFFGRKKRTPTKDGLVWRVFYPRHSLAGDLEDAVGLLRKEYPNVRVHRCDTATCE